MLDPAKQSTHVPIYCNVDVLGCDINDARMMVSGCRLAIIWDRGNGILEFDTIVSRVVYRSVVVGALSLLTLGVSLHDGSSRLGI